MTGILSKDTVTVGNLTVASQAFGAVTYCSKGFSRATQVGGILGQSILATNSSSDPDPSSRMPGLGFAPRTSVRGAPAFSLPQKRL